MDTSDSSDDEKNTGVGKTSKLKIADVGGSVDKESRSFYLSYRWRKMMNILPKKKKRKKLKQANLLLNQQ